MLCCNPISYFNGTRWRFGWTEGRNLTQAEASTDSSDTVLTFAYDLSGLRTGKRVVKKTYDTVLVHSYATTVVAPTCTEGGYTLHSCDCGDSYRTNTTAALGHSYVETGLDTYTCSRCGNTYSDHTHRYTTTVVEPTCTQTGYTTHTCACGHTYQDNAVAELGHDYQRVSQTMTQITYQCTRCGHRHTSPIYDINPPKPPISEYSLDAASTGCASKRVLKSTVTQEHSYLYAGDKLLRETITGNGPAITLDFRYDNLGLPYSLTYQKGAAAPVTYYYITNLQGDVMYLVDSQGSQAAAYTYDPFGKTLSAEGPMAELNPLRYRGYYQDGETGFYYLQSRYYDPAICRFLNADSYASTGQSYLGYNAFAYCGNNPINRADADGEFWDIVFDVVSLGFSIADVIQNPSDPMAWAGLVGDVVDVVVPFVSGVGEATKAIGAVADVADVVDDVHDAARIADNVDDAYDAVKAANGVGNSLEATKSASKLDLDAACFIAGTLVCTEDGYRNIEDIAVGDYVWAWDEETGDVALKQVVETYVHEKSTLVHIFAGGEEITATSEHPFYSPGQGWTAAAELQPGDVLLLLNGDYVIVDQVHQELLERPVTVFNFEVENFHTYFVSDSGVLVHNKCSLPNDSAAMFTDDALDAAENYLGPGYREAGTNTGRFISSDGLRAGKNGSQRYYRSTCRRSTYKL